MRRGGFIQTFSGVAFFPPDARPEDIRIEDIAHHLACVNRFTGATRQLYSVGQHSILLSREVPPADALWGLLHDASEAYLNDIARPLKRLPEWSSYREIEARLMAVICERFGLPLEQPESVSIADRRMLRTEQRDLMPPPCEGEDRSDAEPYPMLVVPWHWQVTEASFIRTFDALTVGREVA